MRCKTGQTNKANKNGVIDVLISFFKAWLSLWPDTALSISSNQCAHGVQMGEVDTLPAPRILRGRSFFRDKNALDSLGGDGKARPLEG